MPSFDVVSELNWQEVDNAVNQTMREIGQRYDFRSSQSALTIEKKELKLVADDDFKANALLDIFRQKCAKRGIDLKALDVGAFEPSAGSSLKCTIKVKEGVPTDEAKQIVKAIKEANLKVQAQIQDQQVRVTGKKKDDLQAVMQLLRTGDFAVPLQFTNFRD
ncbi:MAG: YajQ family cyclic di-GMP-binding protein [Deltaproteobacteria bacterium]|nr:YajQ family cyclic di-GMP-binding protein [Deltaproteobacteria bacterium]